MNKTKHTSNELVIFEPCSVVIHPPLTRSAASTAVNTRSPAAGDLPVLVQNMEHSLNMFLPVDSILLLRVFLAHFSKTLRVFL